MGSSSLTHRPCELQKVMSLARPLGMRKWTSARPLQMRKGTKVLMEATLWRQTRVRTD